jgi:hypothetical protein
VEAAIDLVMVRQERQGCNVYVQTVQLVYVVSFNINRKPFYCATSFVALIYVYMKWGKKIKQ